ncbi:Transcription factor, MADS-box [Corchorus olitorius]|uniref:Transcription factor, MADS-box n=1 Tax=Corchorus olitorius TaxID=93759 RepID=A0A1R3IIX0_9ROSI|nr:Transcription factor, MADS-box [Corchorus olitorius]
MTRKKVKLAYIANDSARKATFKKRKKGLMKKMSELSTLCDIKACAIIYSPYDSQPEVWPSPAGVQHVLSKFRDLSEMQQTKKMMNQESFLRQRITKANEQLKKQCKENREKEMTQVMYQNLSGEFGLQNLMNMADLNDLGYMIDMNLKDINKRVESLAKVGSHDNSQGSPAADQPEANSTGSQQFINLQENIGFGMGGDEMMNPFASDGHNNGVYWSNGPFFP